MIPLIPLWWLLAIFAAPLVWAAVAIWAVGDAEPWRCST